MSENDRIGHIQNTVDCIEANMYQHLSMEDISGQVYLSRYHLQRIFKSLTGRGIMEYARSRKLTESLYELIHTGDRIVSIAEKYGFEYEQSFTRAFKGEFGLSPSEYRRSPRHVPITPKADPSLLIELDHALLVRPFHVFRPAFELGGLLHQVSIQENLQEFKATSLAVEFFHGHRSRIMQPVNPNVYYGYTFWGEERGQYTYYLSSVEIEKDSALPIDMKRLVVPAGSYTVFRFIGFFPPEELTWEHLLEFWDFKDDFLTKNKPIDWENHFHFEYVDRSLCTQDYCELDYYVPVV
ncbi:helix-turn-helix domain-containing protein [Paenibacillus sp. FSL H7-0350]|uniref:helix-turn-helix domain-containing protein n=1 Tax=Paenibacillus sp. FSL H7-0350 TaxID=2975345 RepID=UPI0031584A00